MNAQQYLRSLITGQGMSSIPIQPSELKMLLAMLIQEQGVK